MTIAGLAIAWKLPSDGPMDTTFATLRCRKPPFVRNVGTQWALGLNEAQNC